jgi:hypothetical protein
VDSFVVGVVVVGGSHFEFLLLLNVRQGAVAQGVTPNLHSTEDDDGDGL